MNFLALFPRDRPVTFIRNRIHNLGLKRTLLTMPGRKMDEGRNLKKKGNESYNWRKVMTTAEKRRRDFRQWCGEIISHRMWWQRKKRICKIWRDKSMINEVHDFHVKGDECLHKNEVWGDKSGEYTRCVIWLFRAKKWKTRRWLDQWRTRIRHKSMLVYNRYYLTVVFQLRLSQEKGEFLYNPHRLQNAWRLATGSGEMSH